MIPLTATGISVSLGRNLVLDDVSFSVARGEWLGIIGANGAGKSTLLRSIVGLQPCDGDIAIGDREIGQLSLSRRAQMVAYVPQHPIRPEGMSLMQYVLLGRNPHLSHFTSESAHDVGIVNEVIEALDLTRLSRRDVATLSGGEGQRASLARALAQQSPVIVLDEPTASLDIGGQQEVLGLIEQLRIDRQLTVISTMHDLTIVGQYSDRLLLLSEGKLVAEGPPDEVLTQENIAKYYNAQVRIELGEHGVSVTPLRPDRMKQQSRVRP